MAERYVATTGSDAGGNGTEGNPWATLSYAIGQSSSGDYIWLADGLYDQELAGGYNNKNITVQSISQDYTKVTIKPKTVAKGSSASSCYLYTNGAKLSLWDCSVIFDKNYLTAARDGGNGNAFVEAYSSYTGVAFEAVRCSFTSLNFTGTYCSQLFFSGYYNSASLYKCTTRGFSCNFTAWQNATFTTRNCIFIDNTINVYNNDEASITINDDYNCFYNNVANFRRPFYSLGAHSITSNPVFTTAPTLDPSSPCIDAGIPVAGYVDTWGGSAPDMGVYEYYPPSLPVAKIAGIEAANVAKVSGIDAANISKIMGIG